METKLWVLSNPLTIDHLATSADIGGTTYGLRYSYHNCRKGIELQLTVTQGKQSIAEGSVTFLNPWRDYDMQSPDYQPREFGNAEISEIVLQGRKDPRLKEELTAYFWRTIAAQRDYLGVEISARTGNPKYLRMATQLGFL
jgi:hypothetical protein